MKIFIAFAFLALIVNCYGKPQENSNFGQSEKHMQDMIDNNVQIQFKWTVLQRNHTADGSKNDFRAARARLEQICHEYAPGLDSSAATGEMSKLCDILSEMSKVPLPTKP